MIAVNAGGVPFVYQEAYLPRIISVLFPFGDPAVRFDRRTNTFGELFFTYRAELKKKSGTTIPTTIFEQEESRGISAVVYSTAEAFNCRGLLDCDLIPIHNPMKIVSAIAGVPATSFVSRSSLGESSRATSLPIFLIAFLRAYSMKERLHFFAESLCHA